MIAAIVYRVPLVRGLLAAALVAAWPLTAAAAQLQFRMAIGRHANAGEIERLMSLYEKCAPGGDRPAATRTMLQAVLLRADAMFRSELGGATFQVVRIPGGGQG